MNIEIVTTPNFALNETGFGNLSSCQNFMDSVNKMGHCCRICSCKSLVDLEGVLERKPDLVVLAVKSIQSKNADKICLAEFFENHAMAFTGSSKSVMLFDSDKVLAKRTLAKKGVPTAAFFTAYKGEFQCNDDLPIKYPLFLKPISAANSHGVDDSSYVSSFNEFESKVSTLNGTCNQPALAEEYMSGAEYTVAMLTTKSGELLVAAIEVVPPESNRGQRILSENIKSKNTEALKKIADKNINLEVRKIAFEVFVGIGVEGFARVDIKSNQAGKCVFMEVNLVPGMTMGSSYFPEAFRIDLGLSYDQTVTHIVEHCLSKEIKNAQRSQTFSIPHTNLEFSMDHNEAVATLSSLKEL